MRKDMRDGKTQKDTKTCMKGHERDDRTQKGATIQKARKERIHEDANRHVDTRRVHTPPKIEPYSNWFEIGSRHCAFNAH